MKHKNEEYIKRFKVLYSSISTHFLEFIYWPIVMLIQIVSLHVIILHIFVLFVLKIF